MMNAANKEKLNRFMENLTEDLQSVAIAFVFTVVLVGFVITYLTLRFGAWTGLNEFLVYYIIVNIILLVLFIYRIGSGEDWSLREIGNLVNNMFNFLKERGE